MLAVPLLFVGCAKESEFKNTSSQLQDVRSQLHEISGHLNELQSIQEHLGELRGQTEILRKDLESLQQERDKRTEAVTSLSRKVDIMEAQISELREAKRRDDTIQPSATELKILGEITQDMVKSGNYAASEEWFAKHASEPGFVSVQAMIFDMLNLLTHSTRATLVPQEREARDSFEDRTVASLVKLYNEDPDSAVWVAKFWRTKARQGNAAYFAAKETNLREDLRNSNGTSVEVDKIRERFGNDIEMELTTYYYDHWKEIREMIMDSLLAYEARHAPADKAETPIK